MARTIDVRVAENGRMVLPRLVRSALGLHGETKVILTLEDGAVRLTSIGHGVHRAQSLYKQHVRDDRETDAFLQDRRLEADREDALSSGVVKDAD